MATRAGNATAHPGLVNAAATTTKYTRDHDSKTQKESAQAKKQAKEEKRQANAHAVADIERNVAMKEDASNITPTSLMARKAVICTAR